MLKGSRDAVLHKLQPISIHGQLSYDVHYRFADEPDGQLRVARVGAEALEPGLQEGDGFRLDFLVGVVTNVHKPDRAANSAGHPGSSTRYGHQLASKGPPHALVSLLSAVFAGAALVNFVPHFTNASPVAQSRALRIAPGQACRHPSSTCVAASFRRRSDLREPAASIRRSSCDGDSRIGGSDGIMLATRSVSIRGRAHDERDYNRALCSGGPYGTCTSGEVGRRRRRPASPSRWPPSWRNATSQSLSRRRELGQAPCRREMGGVISVDPAANGDMWVFHRSDPP
jgi:hypothetical protein